MSAESSKIKGNVNYNKDILLSVIEIATTEVPGVSSLSENFGGTIKKVFSNNYSKGIRITNEDDKVIIDVYINVYYGNNVTEMSYLVQKNIKNAIMSMVEIAVTKINVHVMGVNFK